MRKKHARPRWGFDKRLGVGYLFLIGVGARVSVSEVTEGNNATIVVDKDVEGNILGVEVIVN